VIVEYLGRCLPAEGFAGPGVECVSDRLELVGGPPGQVGALREVLAQQPVGVLVRSPLPRAVCLEEAGRQPRGLRP
jgi:hypothetical protein